MADVAWEIGRNAATHGHGALFPGKPSSRRALAAIFAVALLLRWAAVPGAGIYHADELFQYLEQAHRLVFGQGIVPWEYRYGMRDWLLPLAIAPAMALGGWIAPSGDLYLILVRATVALLSLSIVWAAWRLGRDTSIVHGLVAGAIAATWAEFVYLAPHVLSETASIALILPAAALLLDRPTPRRAALAGLLLAGGAILRLQHLPAIVTLCLLVGWRERGIVRPLLIGGAAGLLLGATVDLAMGQAPYRWVYEYLRQNMILDRAAAFGVASPWAYAQAIGMSFGWWTAPLLALAAIGARTRPTLLRVALVNLVAHMAIGHKEYRFILLTTALLLLLAALGTGDLIAVAARHRPRPRRALPWLALAGWATASASIASSGRVARYAVHDRRGPAMFEALRQDPGLCGLATYGMPFSAGGGYSYLHRDVPILAYAPDEGALLRRETRGFNRLIMDAGAAPPAGYDPIRCVAGADGHPAACVFARTGTCAPIASSAEVNRMLVRTDQ